MSQTVLLIMCKSPISLIDSQVVISSRHQLVGYTATVVRHETALVSSKSLYGAYLIFVAQSFRVTFFSTNIWCLFSMTWSLWDQFFCGIIWVPFFRDPFSRGGRFGAGSDGFKLNPVILSQQTTIWGSRHEEHLCKPGTPISFDSSKCRN